MNISTSHICNYTMQHGIVADMMHTLAGAVLCVAVSLSGAIQAPANVALAATPGAATVKPANKEPDYDCEPDGVTKTPNGAVHAIEDCGHVRLHYRMDK
jgi:uncharacterized protein (DUF2147 family)